MNKIPRYYYRGQTIEHTFFEFCEMVNKPLISSEDKQAMLNLIKRMFVVYWKFLRDLLKEKNIIEYYPRNIIPLAIKDGIIDDSSLVWIDYIDILNTLIYAKGKEKQNLIDKIIKIYPSEVYKIHDFISKKMNDCNIQENLSQEISLPFVSPQYNAEELGIYKSSYTLLMNFFKTIPNIKYVWFHGSRAKGNYLPNSDIDLLVDCPLESFEDIKSMINVLRIPYRIDISNIHDNDKKDFLIRASENAKMLYRKNDF